MVVISGPAHILSQSSSCIDLTFTDQPHLVTDCGTYVSLNLNCHHQITYCKLNLKINYPPPYKRLVWDYKILFVCMIDQTQMYHSSIPP